MLIAAAGAASAASADAAPSPTAEGFFDVRMPVDVRGDILARADVPQVLALGPGTTFALEAGTLEIARRYTTRVGVVNPLTGANVAEHYNEPQTTRATFSDARASLERVGVEGTVFANAADGQWFTAEAAATDGAGLVSAARDADLSTYRWTATTGARDDRDYGLIHVIEEPHFQLASPSLSLTLVGDFTVFLWDADLVVESDGETAAFPTGWRTVQSGTPAREEEVANAVLTVTNGRLVVERAAWTGVHAPALGVSVAGAAVLPDAVGGFTRGGERYESNGMDVLMQGDVLLSFSLVADRTDRALVALAGDVASVSLAPAAKLDRGAFLARTPVAAAATAGSVLVLVAGAVLVMRHRDRLVVRRAVDGDAAAASGVFALEMGDDEIAAAELAVAVAQRPHDVSLLVAHGASLERLGRLEDARTAYERAVRADPSRGEAHYYYARALAQLGLSASALPHLQRALALDPRMREMARADAGFRSFADHPTFAALVA